MKPLTKNKVFRKKFVGDELSGAMNGFFHTRSFNKDSITSMLVKAIRPAKVGTDCIYYDPSDEKGEKVPLRTVYLFEMAINQFEKLEENGLLVKTEDVKSAIELLKTQQIVSGNGPVICPVCKRSCYIYHYKKELCVDCVIDKCFPGFKEKKNE